MRCPNCHAKISDDSKFCPNCGANLFIKCPKCGVINSSNSSFCNKCGTKLMSNEKLAPKTEKKKISFYKTSSFNICSIIAMSFLLLCSLLIICLVFSPLQYDSFFPPYDYTIIGAATTNLKTLKLDAQNVNYVSLATSCVSLLLLATTVITGIIMLAINIPKLINAIKNNIYHDFSRSTAFLLVLFFITAIFFVGFSSNQYTNYEPKLGGSIIFMFIFAPLVFAFNIFVKEMKEDKHDLFAIIFNSISRIILFIFALIIVFHIGGIRFHAISTVQRIEGGIRTSYEDFGNLGIVTFYLNKTESLTPNAMQYIISSIVFSAISFVFEISTLLFGGRLLQRLLATNLSKPLKSFGIVASSFMLIGSILCLVFNKIASIYTNGINSVDTYWAAITSNPLNGSVIICLVLSILSLFVYITTYVIEKTRQNKGTKNEKAA